MKLVTHLVIFLVRFLHSTTITTTLSLSLDPSATTRIKICQNKDCQKRFQKVSPSENLVQTFSDLLPPSASSTVIVESTGCLGQCGNGPNISISSSVSGKRTEKLFGGVDGGLMASAILEVGGGIESPDLLLIASEAIAKSTRATSPEKKIQTLTPAIKSLLSSTTLHRSTALSHALVLRADAYLEQSYFSSPSSPSAVDLAHADAQTAVSIDHLEGRAYRLLAEVEEARGNVLGAMDAVSMWAEVNPSFGVKAKNELSRLASVGGSGSAP